MLGTGVSVILKYVIPTTLPFYRSGHRNTKMANAFSVVTSL